MAAVRRVLITGIGGYVGSSIARRLVDRCQVAGVGRGTKFGVLREIFGGRLELVEGEMADRDTLRRAASGVDVVIHTASPIVERYCRDHPKEAARTIVDGTRNVTEAAAEAGALLVHLSTLSVYSSYRERPMPLREDSALLPDTTYGTLKAEAEREAARIPSVILRISNAYGVGGAVAPHAHMVTRLFVSRAIRAEPLMVLGEGAEGLDLIHVQDVARFVEQVTLEPPGAPLVLNVSAGTTVTLRSLAELVRQITLEHHGWAVEIRSEPVPAGKARPSRWLANDRARALAPWFPAVALADGLREMVRCAPQWAEPHRKERL